MNRLMTEMQVTVSAATTVDNSWHTDKEMV